LPAEPATSATYRYSVQPISRDVPAPRAEFRGVWIATVDNTDWPSEVGLSTEQQQRELIVLLDRAAGLHLNAVLLQVRPSCDALYASPLEPWSGVLTGHPGNPPSPFYDPLSFAITEAHRRGLELHAWVNPFRVRTKGSKFPAAAGSVELRHPDWVVHYGNVQWLDPGNPSARDYSLAVINDIVRRYDLDGIHVDDYFYPYPQTDEKNKDLPFLDTTTFHKYAGRQSLNDWRRANINEFVRRFYTQTKAVKPLVKVGISPFGIWRPGYPRQIEGFDSYESLFGDSRLWLQQGWADYFSPQLYWSIDRRAVSFPVLLSWWIEQNTRGRQIWPGIDAVKFDKSKTGELDPEIEFQIKTIRGFDGAGGEIHFSASFLKPSDPWGQKLFENLQRSVYQEPALIPPTPWLADPQTSPPAMPTSVRCSNEPSTHLLLEWEPPASTAKRAALPVRYVVQWSNDPGETAQWHQSVVPAAASNHMRIPGLGVKWVAVTGVDQAGRVGSPAVVSIMTAVPAKP
jgi:uncharacterized lipoprotein YddW (UPF0748 family)